MGPEFLTIYKEIVKRRLEAKKNKNKVIDAGLKIAINGTFGKLANVYSAIYSPDLLIQVTITGQIALLMLIEALEISGIKVISANTDGVTMYIHKEQEKLYATITEWWERTTGYVTEEARYSALYSRDVNNYIAIKPDGKDKSKGAYSEYGSARNSPLSRNPQMMVCNDAVKAFLATGTPVEATIRDCTDLRRFVTVRSVTGGARKSGQYLGKTVRWYQSNVMRGCIEYVTSGNKVPDSDGAMPLMELPDSFPIDLDYVWYIEKANGILEDLGIPLAKKLKVSI
jgi:DNA polymerase elongation subunit (family B)